MLKHNYYKLLFLLDVLIYEIMCCRHATVSGHSGH